MKNEIEFVTVEIPVYKDNIHKGYRKKKITKALADRELKKDDKARGSAWRGVRLLEEEIVEKAKKEAK